MTNDDILYATIGTPASSSDDVLIEQIKQALTGALDVEFSVNPDLPISLYEQIADLVEQHPSIIAYTQRLVVHGVRPTAALTIKDVFRRLHAGQDEFWYCACANGRGIDHYRFENHFAIAQMLPTVQIDTRSIVLTYRYEWWILGLMSNFSAYQQYYSFGSMDDARKYYAIP